MNFQIVMHTNVWFSIRTNWKTTFNKLTFNLFGIVMLARQETSSLKYTPFNYCCVRECVCVHMPKTIDSIQILQTCAGIVDFSSVHLDSIGALKMRCAQSTYTWMFVECSSFTAKCVGKTVTIHRYKYTILFGTVCTHRAPPSILLAEWIGC